MRSAIYISFSLLLLALGGCGPKPWIDGSEKAPAKYKVTEPSPDDREQFPPEPAKPTKPAQLPTNYPAIPERCSGPCCGERGERVRGVFQRLPIVRRFGR